MTGHRPWPVIARPDVPSVAVSRLGQHHKGIDHAHYRHSGSTIAIAATMTATAANAKQPTKKCYGVSLAGKNDCKAGAGTSCAGSAKANYQGSAWKLVKAGIYTSITTPKGLGLLSPKA